MPFIKEFTPTITAGAYASGDALGDKLIFVDTPFTDYLIHSVSVHDLDQQKVPIQLVLFSENFTESADNTPFSLSAADARNVAYTFNFSSYADVATDVSISLLSVMSLPMTNSSTDRKILYGQLIVNGTPTFTTTSSLIIKVGLLEDEI